MHRATSYAPLRGWILRLASEFRKEQASNNTSASFDIPEVTPINARILVGGVPRRLNLLVPALSQQHLFGGIQTALDVFNALRPYFDQVRIIVTEESRPQIAPDAFYSNWPIISLHADGPEENHIVPAGDRWGKTLAVGPGDYFMATAWWTAYAANLLLEWQNTHIHAAVNRPLVYLIQDYEPGFYPWSAKYALAQSTYSLKHPTIAIINSKELFDYLAVQGHSFHSKHVLHPRLNTALAEYRASCESFPKSRLLLVYGRPGTERNAFPIIVAALRLWASQYPSAAQWKVVAAGENFEAIELGGGCRLRSLGKLSIQDYANTLSSAAVGVSLMISPHPSYPPLEMAAFGARTISNVFANKDLSSISSFIHSVESLDPFALANAVSAAAEHFDMLPDNERCVSKKDIVWNDGYLRSGEESLDVAKISSDIFA
jgi:hypothetical protein